MNGNMSANVASGDALDVREFHVTQSLSSLFDVTVIALSDNPDIDFEAVIGQDASFTLHGRVGGGNSPQTWSGIAAELDQVRVEPTGASTYRLRIVPMLWLTSQRRNHRMFQLKSELDIVEQLLGEWGIPYDMKITGQYKTRKYRVQYGETDYAFISRMLEDAGITFYFEAQGGSSKLVLADAPQKNEQRGPPIAFRDEPSVAADREHVTAVHVGRRVRPGKYTMRDIDYRRPPAYPLMATVTGAGGVEQKLERFHYTPGAFLFEGGKGGDTPHADDRGLHRADEGEGKKLTGKRLAASRGDALTASFACNVIDLWPGMVMSMLDHPNSAVGDGKRLLCTDLRIDGVRDVEFHCRVEARSADPPYHPPLKTPKPKVQGVESAVVVGHPGEEIHTDEFGRIRVQFHWDREGTMDQKSSCWIPVSHPWGGASYGGSNLPRVGQEVLVDFLGGDPDRPMITGRVYTNLQKTPYKLPDHKTRSTWKSDTSPGSNGFNEVMFEDLAGVELVWQQAQKNQRRLVKNDEVITVGNDRAKLVKNNEVETTLANRIRVTEQDHTEITTQNEVSKIGWDMSKIIGGDESRQTGGSRAKTVGGDEDVVIGGDRREAIGAESHSAVAEALVQAIGTARSITVGTDDQITVGGKHALLAEKEIHLKSGVRFVIEAGARLSIRGPAGFIDFTSEGIDIVGDLVRINSGGSPADGSGSSPAAPETPTWASPVDPPKPVMDDVSKTGIAQ